MKKIAIASLLLLSASSISFAASLHSLSKAEITKTFEDKTITTVPLVTMHSELVAGNSATIYLGKNGVMKGHFANKPDHDPQNDEGTWNVKKDGQLCVTWKAWTDNKAVCVSAYKVADGVIFVNADNKFESMVLNNNIKEGDQVPA